MVKKDSQTLRTSVYNAAVQGGVAWIVYAVVEWLFTYILPLIIQPNFIDYKPLHWGFTALLFILYPVSGLITGGLSGLILYIIAKRNSLQQQAQFATVLRLAGTFPIILVFVINLIVNVSVGLSVLVILFISLLLISIPVLSTPSVVWSKRLYFLTNPWVISPVLLGTSWITLEILKDSSKVIKGGYVLTYLVFVLMISFFVQKRMEARHTIRSAANVPTSSTKYFAFFLPVIFVILVHSFFLNQRHYWVFPEIEASSTKTNQPNVLLITMDTVRADHLSLYGYERDTTPHLKKFAEEATLYAHAIASGDMTLSTHASIFTGMYARRHGAHPTESGQGPGKKAGIPVKLDNNFRTLTEILSEKGYLTIGVIANYSFLARTFQLDQGFGYYAVREPILFYDQVQNFYLRQAISNILNLLYPPDYIESVKAEEINREVFKLLGKVKESHMPFFLFINYMDAHWPYTPPSPFDTLYPGKDDTFNSDHYNMIQEEVMKLEREVTDKEYRHLISQYDGGIAYLDYHLGNLIE